MHFNHFAHAGVAYDRDHFLDYNSCVEEEIENGEEGQNGLMLLDCLEGQPQMTWMIHN